MHKQLVFWLPKFTRRIRGSRISNEELNILKNLKILLRKSTKIPVNFRSYYQRVAYHCMQDVNFPVAPVFAIMDLQDDFKPNNYYICISPIHLYQEQHSFTILPVKRNEIVLNEAVQLIKELNKHFAKDKINFIYGKNHRWYLELPQEIDLQTYYLDEVAYKNIANFDIKGNAALYWKKLITEVQMVLHASEVNKKRHQNKKPKINSIWVWGEGCINAAKVKIMKDLTIYSEQTYLKGMSKVIKSLNVNNAIDKKNWLYSQNSLIVLSNYMNFNQMDLEKIDVQAWRKEFNLMEEKWFWVILEKLKKKQLEHVTFDFNSKYLYCLTPESLKKFWKIGNKNFNELFELSDI